MSRWWTNLRGTSKISSQEEGNPQAGKNGEQVQIVGERGRFGLGYRKRRDSTSSQESDPLLTNPESASTELRELSSDSNSDGDRQRARSEEKELEPKKNRGTSNRSQSAGSRQPPPLPKRPPPRLKLAPQPWHLKDLAQAYAGSPDSVKSTNPDPHSDFKYEQYVWLKDTKTAARSPSHDDAKHDDVKHDVDGMPIKMHSTHQETMCVFTDYQPDSSADITTDDFNHRLEFLYRASLKAIEQYEGPSVEIVKKRAETLRSAALENIAAFADIDSEGGAAFLPIERGPNDTQQDGMIPNVFLKRALEGPILGRFLAGSWYPRWNRLKNAVAKTYRLPEKAQVQLGNVEAAEKICSDYLIDLVVFANKQQIPLTVKDIQKAEPKVVEEEGWPALFNSYQLSPSDPAAPPQQVFSYSAPVGERSVPSTNRTENEVVNFRKVVVGCVEESDEKNQSDASSNSPRQRLKKLFTGYRHGSFLAIGNPGSSSEDVLSAKAILIKFLQQACKDLSPGEIVQCEQNSNVRVFLLGLLTDEKGPIQAYIDKFISGECSGRRQIEAAAAAARQLSGKTIGEIIEELQDLGEPAPDFGGLAEDVKFDLAFINVPSNPFALKIVRSDSFNSVNAAAMGQYAKWIKEHLAKLHNESSVQEDETVEKLKEIQESLREHLDLLIFQQQPDKEALSQLLEKIKQLEKEPLFGRNSPQRKLINFCQLVTDMLMAYAEDPAEQAIVNGCQLQVLLLLIAEEMGIVKSAHCKSGEDRTGLIMALVELWSLLKEQDPHGRFPLRWQLDEWIDADGTLKLEAKRYVQQMQQVFKYSVNRAIADANVPGAGHLQIQSGPMPWFSLVSPPACQAVAKSAKSVYKKANNALGWRQRLQITVNQFRQTWRQWRGKKQGYQLLPTDELQPVAQEVVADKVKPLPSKVQRDQSPQKGEQSPRKEADAKVKRFTLEQRAFSYEEERWSGYYETLFSKAPQGDPTPPLVNVDPPRQKPSQQGSSVPAADVSLVNKTTFAAQQMLNATGTTTSPAAGERSYPQRLQDVCQIINTRWQEKRNDRESPSDQTVIEIRKRNQRTMVMLSDALMVPAKTESPDVAQTQQTELVRLCVLTLLNNGVAPVNNVYQMGTQDGPAKPPLLKLTIGRKFEQPEMLELMVRIMSMIQETLHKVNEANDSAQKMPVTLKITDKRKSTADGQPPCSWTCSGKEDERKQVLQELLGDKADCDNASLQQTIETVFKEFDWPVSIVAEKPKPDPEPDPAPSLRLS